jgi:hypothetical protein
MQGLSYVCNPLIKQSDLEPPLCAPLFFQIVAEVTGRDVYSKPFVRGKMFKYVWVQRMLFLYLSPYRDDLKSLDSCDF